jgi:hypothetical protein
LFASGLIEESFSIAGRVKEFMTLLRRAQNEFDDRCALTSITPADPQSA